MKVKIIIIMFMCLFSIGCLNSLDKPQLNKNFEDLYSEGHPCNDGFCQKSYYLEVFNYYQTKLKDPNYSVLIGYMYQEGHGVSQDFKMAVEYYKTAANSGCGRGMIFLAQLYAEGLGVEKDCVKAVKLLMKSADFGEEIESCYTLAKWNHVGICTDVDPNEAVKLYTILAEAGHVESMYGLFGVHQQFYKQINSDLKQEIHWLMKAADKGYVDAICNLGELYNRGEIVPQDYMKAVELFEKGVGMGDAACMNNLGTMYQLGHGVKKDYNKAHVLYIDAAKDGNVETYNNLGILYYNGWGVEQNYQMAFDWHLKAAENGHPNAMYKIDQL